ncbi:hypothetical protein, partial [Faecalimonas umbilicata]|uniref:hypothetical protein n=1 Tax=Faecalimonas umbilicata TaxID=1912855 RepID=UPI00399370F3
VRDLHPLEFAHAGQTKIRTALGTQFLEKSYEKDVISNSIMNVASVIFITIITILEKCVDCVCKK